MNDWKQKELEHIFSLWDNRPHTGHKHSRKIWNERAVGWENELHTDKIRIARSERRILSTANYLISEGALTSETDVIDIGCGPGRFVAEFAKTARSSTGLDLSDYMTGFGAEFAKEEGLSNVSYINADFLTLDIDEAGLRGKYDLVFSSITPAMAHRSSIEKGLAMSRKWFYNSSFLRVTDSVSDILSESFGPPKTKRDISIGFYCMFNQLMLQGYYPKITYFTEEENEPITDIDAAAELYHGKFFPQDEEGAHLGEVKAALDDACKKTGPLTARRTWLYGWLLADVSRPNSADC